MGWEDGEKKRRMVIRSMIVLAVVAVAGGLATNIFTQQVRAQDPLYQCIESEDQPYQAFVTISITVDGRQAVVPKDIGITDSCIRPIHTHDTSGLIHVAFERPYDFKLGHFLWYWNFDIIKYDATVYLNGQNVEEKYLDTVLKDGMTINMDFRSKNGPIV
jgi:hypothetical protein